MGHFKIERIDKDTGKIVETIEFPNHFVDSGKQFMLDFTFNSASWLTGQGWADGRYIGVGRSTDTNAGVTGPTDSVPVDVGGTWDGVSSNDWKMSDEITGSQRAQFSCTRAGNTAHIWGTISDANVSYSGAATSVDITEIGLFLTGAYGPSNDPTDTSATNDQKAGAMLVRGVSYYQQGTGYFARNIIKNQGEDLKIQYVFADFEG